MKHWWFIGLMLFGLGCQPAPPLHVGKYQYMDYSYLDFASLFICHGVKSFAVGSKLELKADSSFQYMNCSTASTGYWRVVNDSLYLYKLVSRWRIDSLHIHGYNGRWPDMPACKPDKFRIYEDKLDVIYPARGNFGGYVERLQAVKND